MTRERASVPDCEEVAAADKSPTRSLYIWQSTDFLIFGEMRPYIFICGLSHGPCMKLRNITPYALKYRLTRLQSRREWYAKFSEGCQCCLQVSTSQDSWHVHSSLNMLHVLISPTAFIGKKILYRNRNISGPASSTADERPCKHCSRRVWHATRCWTVIELAIMRTSSGELCNSIIFSLFSETILAYFCNIFFERLPACKIPKSSMQTSEQALTVRL